MHTDLNALPGIFKTIEPFLDSYGYFGVGALVFLEDFGVPVPGETVLILAALYAGAQRLSIFVVILVAIAAAILGDNVGFGIGRFGGRALVMRFGRYVFINEDRLTRAETFFNRNGGKIIVVARFIEGLRQANGIVAGISEMNWTTFLGFNAIGATLWVGLWAGLGYYAGGNIAAIYRQIVDYSTLALVILICAVGALIVRTLIRRTRHRVDTQD